MRAFAVLEAGTLRSTACVCKSFALPWRFTHNERMESPPLFTLRTLQSRAATAENRQALAGQGGTEGNGIKGSAALKDFKAGATETLLDQRGPGLIRHLWMTSHARDPHALRNIILRMYWEGSETPSVEAPLGDFFGVAHGAAVPMYSDLVCMQEGRGLNCYIPMPFAQSARITVENTMDRPIDWFFYQIDFTLGDVVSEEDGRFHASFRRENPCAVGHDFLLLETLGARGIYLGCVMGVRPLYKGWWGEGEVKIFLDGDTLYPTICGTGLEDYIGSAWGLGEHCTRFQGAPLHRNGFASLYRFHVPDPVYFQQGIRVTVQQMGAELRSKVAPDFGDKLIFNPKNHPRRNPEDGYYLRSDDYCATAYWYQYPLASNRPALPGQAVRSGDLFQEPAAEKPAELQEPAS